MEPDLLPQELDAGLLRDLNDVGPERRPAVKLPLAQVAEQPLMHLLEDVLPVLIEPPVPTIDRYLDPAVNFPVGLRAAIDVFPNQGFILVRLQASIL